MLIVADENIAYLKEYFADIADIVCLNGRYITQSDLKHADALIVRSITPVTRALLSGTNVRFVGSCTIGIDHIDTDYLDEAGIAFSAAPGANANSTAEYVINALFLMAQRYRFNLKEKCVGIIGCGNVGARVRAMMQCLGIATLVNDPPLQERGRTGFVDIDTLLAQADIVSFHVPLVSQGKYPTWRMINAEFLAKLKPDAIIINNARGDLIEQDALFRDIAAHDRRIVLDVWPNEPCVDEMLLSLAQLATPHIAGYSLDGKRRSVEMVRRAFCTAFALPEPTAALPIPSAGTITLPIGLELMRGVSLAVSAAYDMLADDDALRELLNEPLDRQGLFFDHLRRHYPARRDYAAYRCRTGQADMDRVLAGLGFSGSERDIPAD